MGEATELAPPLLATEIAEQNTMTRICIETTVISDNWLKVPWNRYERRAGDEFERPARERGVGTGHRCCFSGRINATTDDR